MDFVLELLLQLFVQVFVELLGELVFEAGFRGVARVISSEVGRVVIGLTAGFGFGSFWGDHLTGGAHWPKLLWASLILAAVAAVRLTSPAPRDPEIGLLRDLVVPPWRWPGQRLRTFIAINLGIAAGIGLCFHPAAALA